MKRLALVVTAIAAFICWAFVSFAEEKAEKPFEFSAGVDFFSDYVGVLSGAEFYDGFVVQPSATISHKSGLYFCPWLSNSPSEGIHSKEGGNELDLYLGYAREFGSVSIDAYYGFYDIGTLGNWKGGDVHAFGVKTKWKLNEIFTPYAEAEYDYLISDKGQDGILYRAGVEIKLHEHFILNPSAGGHNAIYNAVSEPVSYGRITVSAPFEWRGIKIAPEVSSQWRFGKKIAKCDSEDKGGLTKDKVWGGIRLLYTF